MFDDTNELKNKQIKGENHRKICTRLYLEKSLMGMSKNVEEEEKLSKT